MRAGEPRSTVGRLSSAALLAAQGRSREPKACPNSTLPHPAAAPLPLSRKRARGACALALLSLCLLLPSLASADDWPQWRGPTRDGVWRETGIIERFPGPQIKLRWSVPIGGGYCGPTVAQGRVYVSDHVAEPVEAERVHCFQWDTGRRLWTYSYPCDYATVSYKAGPRASVAIYGGRAYSLGTVGHLHWFDAATGAVLWKKNLVAEHQARVPVWGIASAPLVEGDLVIVMAGCRPHGSVTAFDARTGALRWSSLDDTIAYSSPMMIDQAGRRIVVCWTAQRIVGLDVRTGKLYWEYPYVYRRWCDGILTPTLYKDRLFVSSFTEGSLMLKLDADRPTVAPVWRRFGRDERQTDSMHSLMCNPYIADEFIYGFDSYGQFRCLEAGMGNRVWENTKITTQARWGSAHMVVNAGRVWIFNDRGELIIGRVSPRGFDEVSRATLLPPTLGQLNRGKGVTWSHPAFAYRHVFNRNDEELVCASLAADETPSRGDWWKRSKN